MPLGNVHSKFHIRNEMTRISYMKFRVQTSPVISHAHTASPRLLTVQS